MNQSILDQLRAKDEMLRECRVTIINLQNMHGGEPPEEASDFEKNCWAHAQNLAARIQTEVNQSSDLLWLMMKERGAIEVCTRENSGSMFRWPLTRSQDRPYDLDTLAECMARVGLKVDDGFQHVSLGYGRWYANVTTK